MILLALMVATVSKTPVKAEPVGNPAEWISYTDFPSSEWSRATVTTYDLTLDAAGKPVACAITLPSGSDLVDKIVCDRFMARGRYKPARDVDGNPISSVLRDRVDWRPHSFGRNQYRMYAPDVIVSTAKLAAGKRVRLTQIVEIIDGSGAVESCRISHASGDEALDRRACEVVSSPTFSTPVKDRSGIVIRGVRAFNVAFVVGREGDIRVR